MAEENKTTDTSSQAEPVSTASSTSTQATIAPAKKSKKLIGGIIAAVTAVLLIGGGVLGYVWYQNPEKMVADAFANAVKSESVTFSGTVTGTQEDAPQNINVTFDGKSAGNRAEVNAQIDLEGDDITIADNGTIVFAGDDGLFVRLTNIRETLESMFENADGSEQMVEMIVERLDDKWIKLDADSNEGMTREYEEQRQCVNNVMKSFTESRDQQKQLADVYKNNRLLTVKKTGAEAIDGVNSHTFEVSVNQEQIQPFTDAVKETDAAKAMNDCFDEDIFADLNEGLEDMTQESMGDNTKIELWVSTWSHELTQFRISGSSEDSSGDITVKTKFNEEVTVETPAEATPVQDVMNDLMTAFFTYSMQQQGAANDYEVNQDLILELNTR